MFRMKKRTENSTVAVNIYLPPALRFPALLRLHSSAIRLTVLSLRKAFDNALANNGGRTLFRRPPRFLIAAVTLVATPGQS
jgi:hypothetical protein